MAEPLTNAQRGMNAVEALPATVRVGPFEIGIEKWSSHAAAAGRRWGEFSALENVIRVQIDMPTPHKAVDTFLHELFHALFWLCDLGDSEKEEHIVGHLATAMLQIHRDNPWLAGWITEHAR